MTNKYKIGDKVKNADELWNIWYSTIVSIGFIKETNIYWYGLLWWDLPVEEKELTPCTKEEKEQYFN